MYTGTCQYPGIRNKMTFRRRKLFLSEKSPIYWPMFYINFDLSINTYSAKVCSQWTGFSLIIWCGSAILCFRPKLGLAQVIAYIKNVAYLFIKKGIMEIYSAVNGNFPIQVSIFFKVVLGTSLASFFCITWLLKYFHFFCHILIIYSGMFPLISHSGQLECYLGNIIHLWI